MDSLAVQDNSRSRNLIFVVEDDLDISRLIEHNLHSAGYQVSTFLSGSAVVPSATRLQPALFLLDIMLPEMNGFDLCRQIRQHEQLQDIEGRLLAGAFHRAAADVEHWRRDLPAGRPVVAYCADAGTASRSVANALRGAGIDATYLEGGISGWKNLALPTRKRVNAIEGTWVTREHPKIDRIACPWLIRRFINPLAQFIYVPPNEVLTVAEAKKATPYDIKGAEFGHVGDRCSFDAIVGIFDIHDPALDRLATIVRGADTSRPDLAPQCEGLLAISYGLSANCPDDHEMLEHGMVIYDALYKWCRLQTAARAPAEKITA